MRLIVKKLFKTCWRNQTIFIFYKQQYWTSEGIKDDYIAELLIACEEIEKRQVADTALLKHIWPLHRLMADSAREEFDEKYNNPDISDLVNEIIKDIQDNV